MTKAEVRARAISTVGGDDTAPLRYGEAEVGRAIDDGLDELCERTGAQIATTTLTAPQDAHFLPLPAGTVYCLALRDTTTPETTYPIDPVHWTWIAADNRYFIRRSDIRPRMFAAFGLTKILFDKAYSAKGTVELVSATVPETVLGEQDEPDFTSEFHEALVGYAVWRLRLKDVVLGEDLGRAQRARRSFEEGVARLTHYARSRHSNLRQAFYGERKRVV